MKSKGFYFIRYSQIISILGSSISSYAISLWVFEKTKNPTHILYISLASFAPQIYMSLFSGAFIDLFDRKKILIYCNVFLIVVNALMLFLVTKNHFNYWFFLGLNFIEGTIISMQSITLLTLISMFFKNQDLVKVNSLINVITQFPILLSPIIAVFLLNFLGLNWILIIDLITFTIAILGILFVTFPYNDLIKRNKFTKSSFIEGYRLIMSNPKLKSSLYLFMSENSFSGLTMGLLMPLLVLKSNGNNQLLSYNSMIISIGTILGGYLIRITRFYYNNPLKWILIIFIFVGALSRLPVIFINNIFILSILFCSRNILISFVNVCNDIIWQSQVPIESQGKAFGTRRFFAQGSIPIFMVFGALFIDFIFSNENVIVKSYSLFKNIEFKLAKLEVVYFISGIFEVVTPIVIYFIFSKNINKTVLIEEG